MEQTPHPPTRQINENELVSLCREIGSVPASGQEFINGLAMRLNEIKKPLGKITLGEFTQAIFEQEDWLISRFTKK